MNKKNFTLEEVEQMIEDLGFKWNERQIFDPKTEKYKKLEHNSFNSKKQFFISLINAKGLLALPLAEIDNSTFVLKFGGATKIIASDQWKKLLSSKEELIDEC